MTANIDDVLREWETTTPLDHVRDALAGSVVPALGREPGRDGYDDRPEWERVEPWERNGTAMRWAPSPNDLVTAAYKEVHA